eukprot:2682413-Prymnesium_polylepis.1
MAGGSAGLSWTVSCSSGTASRLTAAHQRTKTTSVGRFPSRCATAPRNCLLCALLPPTALLSPGRRAGRVGAWRAGREGAARAEGDGRAHHQAPRPREQALLPSGVERDGACQ